MSRGPEASRQASRAGRCSPLPTWRRQVSRGRGAIAAIASSCPRPRAILPTVPATKRPADSVPTPGSAAGFGPGAKTDASTTGRCTGPGAPKARAISVLPNANASVRAKSARVNASRGTCRRWWIVRARRAGVRRRARAARAWSWVRWAWTTSKRSRRIVSRRARASRGMPQGPWVRERSGRAQPAGSRRFSRLCPPTNANWASTPASRRARVQSQATAATPVHFSPATT